MKALLLWAIALIVSLSVGAKAQDSEAPLRTDYFQEGESVRYLLYYHWGPIWLSAGYCDLNVERSTFKQQTVFRLSAFGSTYPAYDPFFRVRDTLVSYVHPEQLIPYEAYKHAYEGNWFGHDHFRFLPCDTARGWWVETKLTRRRGIRPTRLEYTPNDGFDLLTSIYRMRNCPDKVLFSSQAQSIAVRLDDGEYQVKLRYLGDETISLHKGSDWKAHCFSLSLVGGTVFNEGDVMKLWISQDGRRLPLLIEAPIKVGSVKAVFHSISIQTRPSGL